MAENKGVGVGLIGFGTIGTGVVKVLQNNADVIEQRLGFPLRLVRIADLDLETDRGVSLGRRQPENMVDRRQHVRREPHRPWLANLWIGL